MDDKKRQAAREALAPVIEAEAAAFDSIDTSSVPEHLQNKTFDEVLEDLRDREDYDEAMAEHRANPKTYTFDEVLEELGLLFEHGGMVRSRRLFALELRCCLLLLGVQLVYME